MAMQRHYVILTLKPGRKLRNTGENEKIFTVKIQLLQKINKSKIQLLQKITKSLEIVYYKRETKTMGNILVILIKWLE